MANLHRPLITCEAVITECCFLLQAIPRAVEDVLANVANGNFQIPFKLAQSAGEVRDLMHKYRDTPADFADACLIQMANDLDTADILTLDSDFRHYRWRRNRSFKLLVPLD